MGIKLLGVHEGGAIPGEEDAQSFGRLVASAANAQQTTPAERALIAQNLIVHDAAADGFRIGASPPGSRDAIATEAQDHGLSALNAALAQWRPAVLMLDTLAALFAMPSEIDNSVMTTLMRRVTGAARSVNCAVMLAHHTPKMTREAVANQRGEASLVRGGSAIVNSARVALTITSPTIEEAAMFAASGHKADAIRRIDHVKCNDAPLMAPEFFVIRSEPVRMHDGADHAVRAVVPISPPPSGAAAISNAVRNVVMLAIDAGARDAQGARVPLSASTGGKLNTRNPIQHIAQALMHANQSFTATQAETVAKAALADLRDRIGCVVVQDVPVPLYKSGGRPNGTKTVPGLVAHWKLAPWPPSPPSPASGAAAGPHAPAGTVAGSVAVTPPASAPPAGPPAPAAGSVAVTPPASAPPAPPSVAAGSAPGA